MGSLTNAYCPDLLFVVVPPLFFLSESLLKKQRDPTCCLPRQCASQLLEAPCSREKAI